MAPFIRKQDCGARRRNEALDRKRRSCSLNDSIGLRPARAPERWSKPASPRQDLRGQQIKRDVIRPRLLVFEKAGKVEFIGTSWRNTRFSSQTKGAH